MIVGRSSVGLKNFIKCRVLTLLTGVLAILLLIACTPEVMTRPVGYVRLGPIAGFTDPENHLEELRLLLRRDERGFSVMSTMCTRDLSTLRRRVVNDKKVWYSDFSGSLYDNEGNVLENSASGNLPYFKLVLYPSAPGKARDTLFARIGTEVAEDWRFSLGN